MRPVMMGSWVGDEWQITGGLEPNSVVVVDGALSLTSGAAVKPGRCLRALRTCGAAATTKADVKPPPASRQRGALPRACISRAVRPRWMPMRRKRCARSATG
jgi:hypothetical protein